MNREDITEDASDLDKKVIFSRNKCRDYIEEYTMKNRSFTQDEIASQLPDYYFKHCYRSKTAEKEFEKAALKLEKLLLESHPEEYLRILKMVPRSVRHGIPLSFQFPNGWRSRLEPCESILAERLVVDQHRSIQAQIDQQRRDYEQCKKQLKRKPRKSPTKTKARKSPTKTKASTKARKSHKKA